MKNLLSLEVVPLEKVVLHERVDPARVKRLADRLVADGRLVNPPIVVAMEDQFVVLDGATRVSALQALSYPHIVVQVVSPQNGLTLHTWYHVIHNLAPDQVVELLNGLPEIVLKESGGQRVLEEMFELGGLCYLHTADNRIFLVQAAPGVNHITALNRFTTAYIEAGRVTRTLQRDMARINGESPDLSALVVFPEYTVEQVLQIARAGRQLPAGITRFIVPGRVLRLNADLAYLKSDVSTADKNRWLQELVGAKLSNNQVRFYQEPVYLLDE